MAEYEMEELLPVVGQLVEKYTGYEHTSITYEKAGQLMEAVLYCIGEMENSRENAVDTLEKLDARQAYEIGKACVEEKVKASLKMYNEIISQFEDYGNVCLGDTVRKGLPQFFRWYDVLFQPQNTILTLDYPVLRDLTKDTGIDKIYLYLSCILLEQKFLGKFPVDFVKKILSKYNQGYTDMVENICEIVFGALMGRTFLAKNTAKAGLEFSQEEYRYLERLLLQMEPGCIKKQMEEQTRLMVRQYYENDDKLREYLLEAVNGLAIRFKTAAENGALDKIL